VNLLISRLLQAAVWKMTSNKTERFSVRIFSALMNLSTPQLFL